MGTRHIGKVYHKHIIIVFIILILITIIIIVITFVDVVIFSLSVWPSRPALVKGNKLFRSLYVAPMQSPGCAAPGRMDPSRKKGGAILPDSL